MKVKFKKLFLSLFFVVMLPVMMFLVGCGATPSSHLTGIVFETMKYDEATGLPVFEVDEDVTTDLKPCVKSYPSSAAGYRVYFDPIDKGTAINSSRYTFEDGCITVHSRDFEEVRYKVRSGNFSDTCIIRLKEYPVKISTDTPTMVLNSYDIVPINVQAQFVNTAGVVTYKNITESEFDFIVESSDETILQVPNENRLKFCPVRNGASKADITVTVLNGQGEKTNLSFKISVQVVQKISESFVIVSGVNDFVYDNETVDVDFNNLTDEGGLKRVEFLIHPINDGNLLVEDELEYTIYISSKKYTKVSGDGKYILIDGAVTNDYLLNVIIVIPDLIMSDGSAFAIDINLIIKR